MPTLLKTSYLWLALLVLAIGLHRPSSFPATLPAPTLPVLSPLWLLLGMGSLSLPLLILARRSVALPPDAPQKPAEGMLLDCFVLYLASYQSAMVLTERLLPTSSAILNQGIAQVGSATLALLYLRSGLKRTGATLSLGGKRLGADILWGVLGFLGLLPVLLALEQLSLRLFAGMALPPSPVVFWLSGHLSSAERCGLFFLVALLGPAIEEVFFRGVLLSALRERFPLGPRVVIAALVFALLHPLPTVLPLLALGASYTLLRERRQSLVPGMVAHILQNALAFLLVSNGTS